MSALMKREAFFNAYKKATFDDLVDQALISIHGKSRYATRKFRWLKWAVIATLLSSAASKTSRSRGLAVRAVQRMYFQFRDFPSDIHSTACAIRRSRVSSDLASAIHSMYSR